MRPVSFAVMLLALASPLAAQGRFEPSRWDNPGFAAIMAHGERIPLRAEGDSGPVSMVGSLYWIPWQGACEPPAPCQVPYWVAAGDAAQTEPAVVWALGVAGLPQHVEWLPPRSGMKEPARLRVQFALEGPSEPEGAFEEVEFALGWNSARVLTRRTGVAPNQR
jgi:hypothetical protein